MLSVEDPNLISALDAQPSETFGGTANTHPLQGGKQRHSDVIDLNILLDLMEAALVILAVEHLAHLVPQLLFLCCWDRHFDFLFLSAKEPQPQVFEVGVVRQQRPLFLCQGLFSGR